MKAKDWGWRGGGGGGMLEREKLLHTMDEEASFMALGLSEKIGNIEKILSDHVQKFLLFSFPLSLRHKALILLFS